MPWSIGWRALKDAQVLRPDPLALAAVEVPPLAVDAPPPCRAPAQQPAVLDVHHRELAAREQRFLERGMGALAQVVELRAHVELAPRCVDERDVDRHAEGVDGTAPRIGEGSGEGRALEDR